MDGRRVFGKGELDAGTIRMLNDAYPVGTKVEAIKVNYVPKGMQGFVREVRTNGDISVIWNNGDITSVEFGVDSIRVIKEGQCTLGYSMEKGGCGVEKCVDCGWNDSVARARIRKIRNGGLKKQRNGCWALEVKSMSSE